MYVPKRRKDLGFLKAEKGALRGLQESFGKNHD